MYFVSAFVRVLELARLQGVDDNETFGYKYSDFYSEHRGDENTFQMPVFSTSVSHTTLGRDRSTVENMISFFFWSSLKQTDFSKEKM